MVYNVSPASILMTAFIAMAGKINAGSCVPATRKHRIRIKISMKNIISVGSVTMLIIIALPIPAWERGMVGYYSNAAGKPFVGTELNKKRLAVLMERKRTGKL